MQIQIRNNVETYMKELKEWLQSIQDTPIEEMGEFFTKRIGSYEEHMSLWKGAYAFLAGRVPGNTEKLLDLGCGTGLELEEIYKLLPGVRVTGIDLCPAMLEMLLEKWGSRGPELICGDYFVEELGEAVYDTAVSFQTLHHFQPEKKQQIFNRIFRAVKRGGIYLEADYIACCEEEERLLRTACREKRRHWGIPEEKLIHFDIPLTLEHETQLLYRAGFDRVEALASIEGTTVIRAEKK